MHQRRDRSSLTGPFAALSIDRLEAGLDSLLAGIDPWTDFHRPDPGDQG